MGELFLIIMIIITCAKGDHTFLWLIGGIAVLGLVCSLFCKSSGKTASHERPRFRIDHPHYADHDDYECSICGHRFSRDSMSCPNCGVLFNGKKEDDTEWEEEEDEWDTWDEEEGL